MAKKPPPKRLFKSQEAVSLYKHDRSPTKLLKQMARDHQDVLQNVEFALVTAHRTDPSLDDRVMDEALRAALARTPADDPRVASVVDALASVREIREDVNDDLWDDALKVIRDSIRRHSELRPGETGYLSFASQYVR